MESLDFELCNFKDRIVTNIAKTNGFIFKLLLILIKHIENFDESGRIFLSLLLHNPLNDLNGTQKQQYMSIINSNSMKIYHLIDVLNILDKGNDIEAFEIMNKILENVIYTSSNKSPLKNDWLHKIACNVSPMIKTMEEIYKESMVCKSPCDFEDKFKNRLCVTRKVTVKRTIKEVTTTDTTETIESPKHAKRHRRGNDVIKNVKRIFEGKEGETLVIKVINQLNWKEFLEEHFKMSDKNYLQNASDSEIEYLKELVKDTLKTKLESCTNDIQKLNESVDNLDKKFDFLKVNNYNEKFENQLNDMKTKIETLNKYINENREINEDIKKIQTELTTIRKSARANISASKKTFELFVERKMNEVNDIFSKFTDIRNDINKRIETMSSFVTDYHKKMSAAMAGNAFSLM
tara:strand:- start:412 stop:1629 length:1218 start_codon:yes stop_codon:yes gene_type:complete